MYVLQINCLKKCVENLHYSLEILKCTGVNLTQFGVNSLSPSSPTCQDSVHDLTQGIFTYRGDCRSILLLKNRIVSVIKVFLHRCQGYRFETGIGTLGR